MDSQRMERIERIPSGLNIGVAPGGTGTSDEGDPPKAALPVGSDDTGEATGDTSCEHGWIRSANAPVPPKLRGTGIQSNKRT